MLELVVAALHVRRGAGGGGVDVDEDVPLLLELLESLVEDLVHLLHRLKDRVDLLLENHKVLRLCVDLLLVHHLVLEGGLRRGFAVDVVAELVDDAGEAALHLGVELVEDALALLHPRVVVAKLIEDALHLGGDLLDSFDFALDVVAEIGAVVEPANHLRAADNFVKELPHRGDVIVKSSNCCHSFNWGFLSKSGSGD